MHPCGGNHNEMASFRDNLHGILRKEANPGSSTESVANASGTLVGRGGRHCQNESRKRCELGP